RIPDPGRNEVVQLIVFAKPKPLRHRLNALTSARTDQPRHVEWTHLSPRLVTQPIHKRLEKASKLFFPIRRPSNHGRPLQSRPPMSHRKTDLGIPCRSKSAKVVLVAPQVLHAPHPARAHSALKTRVNWLVGARHPLPAFAGRGSRTACAAL